MFDNLQNVLKTGLKNFIFKVSILVGILQLPYQSVNMNITLLQIL